MSEMNSVCLNYIEKWYWRFVYVHWFKINIWHYSPLLIMLIMSIMLIKKVAQSCRLGNKAEFVHKPIGNMNQSKNLTLLTISRFSGRQLDYNTGCIPIFCLNAAPPSSAFFQCLISIGSTSVGNAFVSRSRHFFCSTNSKGQAIVMF